MILVLSLVETVIKTKIWLVDGKKNTVFFEVRELKCIAFKYS